MDSNQESGPHRMVLSIKGTRMSIQSDMVELLVEIEEKIGSAKVSDGIRGIATCKASIQNITRIRKIAFGRTRATMAKDDETISAVKKMKLELDDYNNEKRQIVDVKRWNVKRKPYEFKFSPYKHQIQGFEFMHASGNGAVFGDPGIGKTAIAASFIESISELGEGLPVLVVCPISIIKQSWVKDFEKFTGLHVVSIYEPSSYKRKEKRIKRLASDADVYIASFSLLRIMEKELRQKKFATIIVDESTKIKNPHSNTFRSLKRISWKTTRRYVLTGTPSPNGPMDLWSQFYFLDNGITLEPSLTDFKHQYFNKIEFGDRGAAFWRPKAGMSKKIYELTEPRSIRFRARDCLDLPGQVFTVRDIPMSGEQLRVYTEMAENLFVELESGESITARVAVSKLMKLREITGGFVIDDRSQSHPISSNPKMDELDELIRQIMATEENKALIWIQYRWEAREIIRRFKEFGASGLYGDVTQKNKDKNVDRFLLDPGSRILVCHPQSAAHGLTLTVANYSIYYSLSYNFEEYYQSSKRIHRHGQDKTTFYYFLTCQKSIDESLLKCIQDKKNVQDLLIDGALDTRSLLGVSGKAKKK